MKFNRILLKEKGNARMFFLDANEITVSMEVGCRRVIDNHLSIYPTILPYTNECRVVAMDGLARLDESRRCKIVSCSHKSVVFESIQGVRESVKGRASSIVRAWCGVSWFRWFRMGRAIRSCNE